MKIKIYITALLVMLIGVISFSFRNRHISCKSEHFNYPGGASLNMGSGYSGASWDNGGSTCNSCHSGGSYNPSTTLSLFSGTTPVTQYIPGSSYTLKMTIISASGTPKYGFNVMSATTASHTNINKWGTLPTGSRNNSVGSRNYVEQTSARTASSTNPSTYILNIPWTAPLAGTGGVTFYAAGMAVNGSGGTGGDSPAPGVNLSITEGSTAPVTISSFKTILNDQNGTLVQWKTEEEINTAYFEIQKSIDGIIWTSIGKVNAKGNSTTSTDYSFVDINLFSGTIINYYRIRSVDFNGTEKYSIISMVSNNKKDVEVICKSIMPISAGSLSRYNINVNVAQGIAIEVYDISGRLTNKYVKKLTAGLNSIELSAPVNKGIYSIKFSTKEFIKTLNQIVQ